MTCITMVGVLLTASEAAISSPHQGPATPLVNARLLAGKKPVRIVCFGDSVTGLYYHTGGRRSYTDLLRIALRRLCPRAEVTTINAGESGHTTRDALKRIDTDVLAKKPSLVTVMFGLNDMTHIPLDEYRANLSTIIEKVRADGAEVILCTPNSVITTTSRPSAKLVQYCDVVRKVAREQNVALCDCYQAYEAIRNQNARAWRLLMSDEIHPNCDGHKLIAEQIARTITGRQVSLSDVGPLQPAIPHTLAKLRANQPVQVLAMPPFAAAVVGAFQRIAPNVKVEIVPWTVETKSPSQNRVGGIQQPEITSQPDSPGTSIKKLTEFEEDAKRIVRQLKPDLVVLAVPRTATSESRAEFIRAYAWIMNWSLSFGRQEWDCVVVHPDVTGPQDGALTNKTEHAYDDLIRQLVVAQDLTLIDRPKASTASTATLFADWLEQQWRWEPEINFLKVSDSAEISLVGEASFDPLIRGKDLAKKVKRIYDLTIPDYPLRQSVSAADWQKLGIDTDPTRSPLGPANAEPATATSPSKLLKTQYHIEDPSFVIAQVCADLSNDGARTMVYSSRGTKATHLLRASDGATLWTQKIPGQHQSLMAHDLNDDGTYEIIKSVDNYAKDDAHDAVYAFETDGELLWKVAGFSSEDSPNVADLNGDGQVEIVGMTFGSEVYCLDGKGNIKWRKDLRPELDDSVHAYMTPILCDVNGDQQLEILALTNGSYFETAEQAADKPNGIIFVLDLHGNILDRYNVGSPRYWGTAFVCNVDEDPYMELVASGSGGVDIIQTKGFGPNTEHFQRRRTYQRLNVVPWAYEDTYFNYRGEKDGVVCLTDNLILDKVDQTYRVSGTYTTELLTLPPEAAFDSVDMCSRVPEGTSLTLNILSQTGDRLSEGITESQELQIKQPVRLQFVFATKDQSKTPLLDYYRLSFQLD